MRYFVNPELALSVRQPWAWLIVNGHKDIENREWATRQVQRVFIHTGTRMTRPEYDACRLFCAKFDKQHLVPNFHALMLGGIVGAVDIVGCVTKSESPWFVGAYGFQLANAQELPFRACKGSLGFFRPIGIGTYENISNQTQ